MKRQLNEQETKLEKLGVENNKKALNLLKENLQYNKELLEVHSIQRKFDDKWRDFLRRQKDEEDKRVLEIISDELKNKENLIKTGETHLKEGVETLGVG